MRGRSSPRLRNANEVSLWSMRAGPGRRYQLIARPLLPDERNCASLAALKRYGPPPI